MTVYTVYFSFLLFVLMLSLVNFYYFSSFVVEKKSQKKISQKQAMLNDLLVNYFEKETSTREETVQQLKKYLGRPIDLVAFSEGVRAYYHCSPKQAEISYLLTEVIDVKKITRKGLLRKSNRMSYALYFIAECRISGKEVGAFALSALNHSSLHVRNHSLSVISQNDDLKIVLQAMTIINEQNRYFTNKTIIDFLDSYQGNQGELDKYLCLALPSYHTNLKKEVINHFINQGNDHHKIRNQMFAYLKEPQDKELVISSTRYFYKIIDPRVKNQLLDNLTSQDWEIRAVSAKVSEKYPCPKITKKLQKALGDSNYYVRQNSAKSYLKLVDQATLLQEVQTNKDPFARDTLLYFMSMDGRLQPEEYQKLVEKQRGVDKG